jgi:hypothetical protein
VDHQNEEDETMAAVDRPVTMPRAEGRWRHRARLSAPAVGVLAAACALAACGGGSATLSSRSSRGLGGAGGKGGTTPIAAAPTAGSGKSSSGGSASGTPKACTLVSAAQVSAALGVSINRTSEEPEGNGTECSWTFTATSLVKGLGTNATLEVARSATGMTRSAFYRSIEKVQALKFVPVTVDGIPAVQGFGSSQPEVVVDIGPVTITVAALSTISTTDEGPAALAITGDAVSSACRRVRCSH